MNLLMQAIAQTEQKTNESQNEIVSVENMITESKNFDKDCGIAFQRDIMELFKIKSVPVSSPFGQIKGQNALYTLDENGKPIECINGKVSDRYKIHQPIEVIKAFESAANNCNLTIKKVLTNPYTGGLLINAEYGNCRLVGENHNVQINFYTAHDGKRKTFASLDLLRMACFNQIPTLFRNKERHILSEKHYNPLCFNALEKLISEVPNALNRKQENIEKLRDTKLSLNDFLEIWIKYENLDRESKSFGRKIQTIRDIYINGRGQENIQNTAYAAYQAVTYNNTHTETRRTKNEIENGIKKQNNSLLFEQLLLETIV